MKTQCCQAKIESNERFCPDCGWEPHVYHEAVQLEFSFSLPFILEEEKIAKDEKQFWYDLFNNMPFPSLDFSIRDLFKHIDFDDYTGPSIPLTIVKGDPNQPEFDFVREIDETSWGFPVRYHYELPKEFAIDKI